MLYFIQYIIDYSSGSSDKPAVLQLTISDRNNNWSVEYFTRICNIINIIFGIEKVPRGFSSLKQFQLDKYAAIQIEFLLHDTVGLIYKRIS